RGPRAPRRAPRVDRPRARPGHGRGRSSRLPARAAPAPNARRRYASSRGSCFCRALDRHEVDLPFLDVHADEAHVERIRETERPTGALADEPRAGRVAVIVVARERGHVHEAVDLELGYPHEEPERHDRGHDRAELLADALAHVDAFELLLDVPH